MRKFTFYLIALLGATVLVFQACQDQEFITPDETVSEKVIDQLVTLGFDVVNQAPIVFEEGYLVEGDIYLTPDVLEEMTAPTALNIPTEEQYHTFNLVNAGGGRTIAVYMPVEGSGGGKGKGKKGGGGFSSTYDAALDEAIDRFNAESLTLTFVRTTNSSAADIVFTRLNKRDERRGVLGSAGFPSNSGDPYGEIKMSGILESTYGVSQAGIATIMAHEVGHCVGFRHTDWFDRSISCGGAPSNEGQETTGVGAIHIAGTPTGADLGGPNGSWMLACTDGSSRPFTSADKTALDFLY